MTQDVAEARVDLERLAKLADEATPGEWKRCHHLMGPEQDASCPCGYRGGIWSEDKDCIILEMGGPKTPGEEGLDPPRLPRAEELANAAFIAAANPATIKTLLARVAALEEENADLKENVIAFAAPHAVIYARDFGLPEGHLNSQHYDLLERCGARMVDFTRSDFCAENTNKSDNPQDERGRE